MLQAECPHLVIKQIFDHENIFLGYSVVEDRGPVPLYSIVDVPPIVDKELQQFHGFGVSVLTVGNLGHCVHRSCLPSFIPEEGVGSSLQQKSNTVQGFLSYSYVE